MTNKKIPPERQTGKHHTDYADRVKHLIEDRRHPEAIQLLLKLIDQMEDETQRKGTNIVPWYYEQLAAIYHKEKRIEDEINVLERFMKQPHPQGMVVQKLDERLIKARQLLGKTKPTER